METMGQCPICDGMYAQSSTTTGRRTHYDEKRDGSIYSVIRAMVPGPSRLL